MQKALRTDGSAADVVYFAFDVLFAGDEDLRERPLRDRKEILRQLIRKHRKKVGPVLRYVEHFDQDGPSIAGAACQSHLEGIVSKRAEAPYRPGKGPSWRKVKCRPLYDLVVAGWYPDRTGAVACLLMGAYDPAGDLVYVGRVGTGFTESGAGELAARLAPIAADRSPFRTGPRNSKHVRWVAPALVASITVTDWLGARIRHGSYKGVRTDVAPNDARLPPPRSPDPDDAGPGAHRRPRGHVKVGRAGYP